LDTLPALAFSPGNYFKRKIIASEKEALQIFLIRMSNLDKKNLACTERKDISSALFRPGLGNHLTLITTRRNTALPVSPHNKQLGAASITSVLHGLRI